MGYGHMYATPPPMDASAGYGIRAGGGGQAYGGMVVGGAVDLGAYNPVINPKLAALATAGGAAAYVGGYGSDPYAYGTETRSGGYTSTTYGSGPQYAYPPAYTPAYPYNFTPHSSATPSISSHLLNGYTPSQIQERDRRRRNNPEVVDPALLARQIELMQRTVDQRGSTGTGSETPESLADVEVPCPVSRRGRGRKHRGFGASANVFNADGSVDVGGWCFLFGVLFGSSWVCFFWSVCAFPSFW
ncbi:hypothetical protein HDV00_001478 [Rhizophlyctis rosea]|nr:hypothetical protein HDV00_001478 [Rhizophlyctis rosea]